MAVSRDFLVFFKDSNPPGQCGHLINRLKRVFSEDSFSQRYREISDSAQTNTARSQTNWSGFQTSLENVRFICLFI